MQPILEQSVPVCILEHCRESWQYRIDSAEMGDPGFRDAVIGEKCVVALTMPD